MFLSYTLHRIHQTRLLRYTTSLSITSRTQTPFQHRYATQVTAAMPDFYDPAPYRLQPTDTERLSDIMKLSPHVTRILGQNPGQMTLQGTNSYLLQPPSNPLAPCILIDTSSPHTANQYVDLLLTHLFGLGMGSGNRETHFDSTYAKISLAAHPEEKHDEIKAQIIAERASNPRAAEIELGEYGDGSGWSANEYEGRKLPAIEHIILTHRHLDHVGAVGALLNMLKQKGLPRPKIWKFLNPDETTLASSEAEKDRATTDAALVNSLPKDSYIPFQPLQPLHPLMPGLMLSLIDPEYKYLVERGRVKWNDVPEMARVSVRCLKTPGHTADSVALVMCEGDRGVFTADTVLGQGTTMFEDLTAYMTSLKTLLALQPKVLYPAHGPHVPGAEASREHIQTYITHRLAREQQIIAILTKSASDPKSTLGVLKALLEGYEEKQAAEWKYKQQFLGRLKPDPSPTPQNLEKKAKEEKKQEERKKEEGERLDVNKKEGGGISALSLDILIRLIYKTPDEKVLFAARKGTLAHLVKLMKEGKVVRREVMNPVIRDGDVKESAEVECWEWAEEV